MRDSGFKRCAAATGSRRVWIHNLEARAGEPVVVIERRALEEPRTLLIHEELHAITFHDRVIVLLHVERHLILETGAAAFCDLDAQTFPSASFVGLEQRSELADCIVRDLDHGVPGEYRAAGASQPDHRCRAIHRVQSEREKLDSAE